MVILKRVGKGLLAIALVLVLLLISVVMVMILTDIIMVEDSYLFYERNQLSGAFLLLLTILPTIILSLIFLEKFNLISDRQKQKNARSIAFWHNIGNFKFIFIIVYFIAFYICFTNITVVTEDKIICKTTFNPSGKIYAYSDVSEVEVGFGDKFISCNEYQEEGNFYYKIKLDGKEIVFYSQTSNDNIERYKQTPYLEILEFDTKLKLLDVKKTVSGTSGENSGYDDETLNILNSIINN